MSAPTVADLHLHSCHSDGVLEPAALIELCVARGVSLLALTDHDTLHGLNDASKEAARLGVGFINGVEISAAIERGCLHILAPVAAAAMPAPAAAGCGRRIGTQESRGQSQ